MPLPGPAIDSIGGPSGSLRSEREGTSLGPPAIGARLYRFFSGGGFLYYNRLQKKVGTLILTSLLEDLAYIEELSRSFGGLALDFGAPPHRTPRRRGAAGPDTTAFEGGRVQGPVLPAEAGPRPQDPPQWDGHVGSHGGCPVDFLSDAPGKKGALKKAEAKGSPKRRIQPRALAFESFLGCSQIFSAPHQKRESTPKEGRGPRWPMGTSSGCSPSLFGWKAHRSFERTSSCDARCHSSLFFGKLECACAL